MHSIVVHVRNLDKLMKQLQSDPRALDHCRMHSLNATDLSDDYIAETHGFNVKDYDIEKEKARAKCEELLAGFLQRRQERQGAGHNGEQGLYSMSTQVLMRSRKKR